MDADQKDALRWASAGEARGLLKHYDLGASSILRRITVGENSTYRVRTTDGVFALRLYRPRRWSPEDMLVEHAFMAHLGADLGVFAPVQGRDGRTLYPTSTSYGAVFPWVPGRMVHKRVTTSHCRRLGAMLAALHERSASFGTGSPRTPWNQTTLLTEPAERVRAEWDSVVGGPFPHNEALEQLHSVWDKLTPNETFLHADLHLGNIKFTKSQIYPIDFDDCGYGPIGYEFGILGRHTLDRPALGRAFLESYNAAAKVEVSLTEMALFTAVRCVWICAWVLERPEIFTPKDRAILLTRDMNKITPLARQTAEAFVSTKLGTV